MSSRSFPAAFFLAHCEAGSPCASFDLTVLHPAAHRERHHAAPVAAFDLVKMLGRVGGLGRRACVGSSTNSRVE